MAHAATGLERVVGLLRQDFDAALLDLDGVLTATAALHAAAWKALFDPLLAERGQPPFDPETDYRRHVDGLPREDGVRAFLEARGIVLPEGPQAAGDSPFSVQALAAAKQACFLRQLRRQGVRPCAGSERFLRLGRGAGLRTAVVSSSRNAGAIVQAAGLAGLLDARVDGRTLRRQGLRGKPAPDMFLEACRRLEVPPARALAVEDAEAGVQAARAAHCGLVVGVAAEADRARAAALRRAGADAVVPGLWALQPLACELPSALDDPAPVMACVLQPAAALFLDFDGTLSPIVARPGDAVLAPPVRALLRRLARHRRVSILSGRDLAALRTRIDLDELWYAGSHGFEIAGPDGVHWEHPRAQGSRGQLDRAETRLRSLTAGFPGTEVERKAFAVAAHYRRLAEHRVAAFLSAFDTLAEGMPCLRPGSGKKVRELRPDIDWDKGQALQWLSRAQGLQPGRACRLYVGDDLTDEDALAVLGPADIGIVVEAGRRPSRAHYRLHDPAAVSALLGLLAERLEQAGAGEGAGAHR